MEGDNAAWSELLGAIAKKEADIVTTETQISAREEYIKYLNDENQSYVDKIEAAEKEKEDLKKQRLALKEDIDLIKSYRKQSDWILKKLRLDVQRAQAKIEDQQEVFEKDMAQKLAQFDEMKEYHRSRLPRYVELQDWLKQKEEMQNLLQRTQTNNKILGKRIQDYELELIEIKSKREEDSAKQNARVIEKAELVKITKRLRSEVDALFSKDSASDIKSKIDSIEMLQNLEVLQENQPLCNITVHNDQQPQEKLQSDVPMESVKHLDFSCAEIKNKQPKDIINILQDIIVNRPATSSQLFEEDIQQSSQRSTTGHHGKDARLTENLEMNMEKRSIMPPPDMVFEMQPNFIMPLPEPTTSRNSEINKNDPLLCTTSNQFDIAHQQATNRAALALKSPDQNADHFFSLSPMEGTSGGDKYTNSGGLESVNSE